MSPRVRKAVLVSHVVAAVGWLGLDLGLLALGITGLTTGDPETLRAAYLAMDVLGDVLLIPISLAALLTGLIAALGTQWGLARYYWVLAKLVLTVAAGLASTFALRGHIEEAARQVSGLPPDAVLSVDLGRVALTLVTAPTVALAVYTAATVLSIYKPWGRTPYGRRRSASRGTGQRAERQLATSGRS